MADEVQRGMSDKGTLRDPSKMVSNGHRAIYSIIFLAVLAFVGFTVYSVTVSTPPAQSPSTTSP
jgi:hypothetical protein